MTWKVGSSGNFLSWIQWTQWKKLILTGSEVILMLWWYSSQCTIDKISLLYKYMKMKILTPCYKKSFWSSCSRDIFELVQNVARNSCRVLRTKTRDPNLEGDPGRQIWIWGSSFKFFGRPGRENLSARRPEFTSLLLLLTFAPLAFFWRLCETIKIYNLDPFLRLGSDPARGDSAQEQIPKKKPLVIWICIWWVL